jgi:translation initiation factor 5B
MAPKKKGNKKADDDWENEVAETPETVTLDNGEAKQEGGEDEAEGMSGGLMAALRKNKNKKAKKGKPVQDDFVDGEDPENGDGADTKAPEEATAEDLFAPVPAKGKGGKGGKGGPAKQDAEDDGDAGGLKSKKEKEKEKKEREKQRKKEQVRRLTC